MTPPAVTGSHWRGAIMSSYDPRDRSRSPSVLCVHGSSSESSLASLPPLPPPSEEPPSPLEDDVVPGAASAARDSGPRFLSFPLEKKWHATKNESKLKQMPFIFHTFAAAEKVPYELIIDSIVLNGTIDIYIGGTEDPIRRWVGFFSGRDNAWVPGHRQHKCRGG